jgi:hypothetical protein
MIQRAIALIDRLTGWIMQNAMEKDEKKRLLKKDKLEAEDWRILKEILRILKPFYN